VPPMSSRTSTTRTGCFPGPDASLAGTRQPPSRPAAHMPRCPQPRRTPSATASPPGPASELNRINDAKTTHSVRRQPAPRPANWCRRRRSPCHLQHRKPGMLPCKPVPRPRPTRRDGWAWRWPFPPSHAKLSVLARQSVLRHRPALASSRRRAGAARRYP
jgi:hypothetical protein